MANTNNDQLFLLIKSLSGGEKRHFKTYILRNKANEAARYVRLFDLMDKSNVYKEEQVFKKIPSIARPQLSNIKSHLYGELLTALRLQYSSKSAEIQIREQIDFARILYNRGLILQALKILDRVKSQAKTNSHFILTLEILQFEKYIEARHITRSLKGRAGALIDETEFSLRQINDVTQLSNLALQLYELFLEHGHAKDEKQSAELEKFFRKKIKGVNEEQVSFFGKAYLHQCYCWYYMIQLDFTKYYRHAEKWVQLFTDFPEAKKEDPSFFVKAMHNLLNALFNMGRHQRMKLELDKLERFYLSSGTLNKNLEVQTFVYLYTAKINEHFLEGSFTKGLELVGPIEEKLKEYQLYIDTHRVLVFYYKIACLYFGSGDSDKAITYLNKIIHLKVGQLRSDIQCFARLLHLIAHYELGNTELVEYLIRSVYRFLSKMENLDAVLAEVFAFLRRSLSSQRRDVTKAFMQLKDKLEKISADKYSRRSYQYLDIVSWLESKIEQVPVQEIIRKKFEHGK